MSLVFLFFLFLFISQVEAQGSACHKGCHGHGTCSKWNTCDCFTGWEGFDCTRKSCPTGPAFVDIPSSSTTAHAPIECSGQGICDYTSGMCKCHAGYSGYNCAKTYCLNDCNGHGQCINLATAAFDNDGYHLNRTNNYALWDSDRNYGCNCNFGFQGADCSQRICDYGVDPRIDTVNNHEIVTFACECTSNGCRGRFKFRLFGQELRKWLTPTSTTKDLLTAILESPGIYQNSSELIYPSVDSLDRSLNSSICATSETRLTKIRFRRNYGDIPPLTILGNFITGGSVYFLTYQTIECNCLDTPCNGTFRVSFDGQMSPRIPSFSNGSTVLIALQQMKTFQNTLYTITATTNQAICVADQYHNFTITFQGPVGNAPKIGLWSSVVDQRTPSYYSTNRTAEILKLFTYDGRDDTVKLCNGIGACDFDTGVCQCPFGWGFDANLGECGQFTVNSSAWTGFGRCPGVIDVSQIGRSSKTTLDFTPNYPTQIYFSMNPIETPSNRSAIYVAPWIAEAASGAEFNRGSAQLFINLTSNQSAGPIVLDSAAQRIFFIDNNPDYPFIGVAKQFNNENSSFVYWYHFTYKIYGFVFDAYFGRRNLYWSVPGEFSLDEGAIYWASADSVEPPTVYSLTSTIGQKHLYYPRGLAIHYARQRIYWVDRNSTSSQHSVLRSSNLDGTDFQQNHILTKIDNETISVNVTDLVLLYNGNDTVFLLDPHAPAKLIAINLNAPIYFNDSAAGNNSAIYEFYYSPRILNVSSLVGGLVAPHSLYIDDQNEYLLWTEPTLDQIRFTRYVHTIWDDIEGSGIAYNGHIVNPKNSQSPYRYKPVSMVFDRGLGPPTFGNTVDCYGNGICGGITGQFSCNCNDGFEDDCQTALCPLGRAWFNEPIVDNIAHDVYAECSNIGVCDRSSGLCVCEEGYEGAACDRSSCVGDPSIGAVCFNKGKCRSLQELGQAQLDSYLDPVPVDYGALPNSPLTWDADMIYGCLPDRYGWYYSEYNITTISNFIATEYYCPYGYNRRLSDKVYPEANYSTAYEIQQLVCSAHSGSFQLYFRGEYTTPIYANASDAKLQDILQQLSTVGPVSVSMTGPQLCSDITLYQTNITFLAQFGNVPLLSVYNNELRGFTNTVTITQIQSGTASSYQECSGHGECNRANGICKCWEGYGPSDGLGNVGNIADCGYSYL